MVPVLVFTLLYNVPKFFELTTERLAVDEFNQPLNLTLEEANRTIITLQPTNLRLNEWYIRIYIQWLNIVLHIIGPFILLIVLNVLTYRKILDFERTLSDTLRIRFTSGGGGGTSPNISTSPAAAAGSAGRKSEGKKQAAGGEGEFAEVGHNGGGGGGVDGNDSSHRLLSGGPPPSFENRPFAF